MLQEVLMVRKLVDGCVFLLHYYYEKENRVRTNQIALCVWL